jgi:exosortase C (VPDSG-CTERM-specific)
MQSNPSAPAGLYPRRWLIAVGTLTLAFAWPLYELVAFALQSSLYSHIPLIPFISAYLVWTQRSTLPGYSTPNRLLAVIFFAIGLGLLASFWLIKLNGVQLDPVDSLALTTLAYLSCFAGLCAWLLGRSILAAIVFPLVFLLFMVPMPTWLVTMIETLLQHGSAAVAHSFFTLAGTTVFVDGLTFQLSTITIQVAPECSGIHSSLALLITSVVTGRLLLRSPRKRLVLALAVIPLALVRNGLRIFVIGELCVRIGPEMIDSYIHRHGGPIFFILSLIPFFLLLIILLRLERKSRLPATPCQSPSPLS